MMLALTNKHVISRDTTTPYEYAGTSPQYMLVCGERRFTRPVGEIEAAVNTGIREAPASKALDELYSTRAYT